MTQKLGEKIDQFHELHDKKKELEEQLKELEAKIEIAEADIISSMDAEAVLKSAGTLGGVGIEDRIRPNIEDWDEFIKYVINSGNIHLLERRASITGCREMLEMKGSIPGIIPFVKRSLRRTKFKKG